MVDPEVDLVTRVRVEVEAAGRVQLGERVGARSDRLCLQRFRRPALGHLRGDDAAEVEVEIDDVDDPDRRGAQLENPEGSAIPAAVQ